MSEMVRKHVPDTPGAIPGKSKIGQKIRPAKIFGPSFGEKYPLGEKVKKHCADLSQNPKMWIFEKWKFVPLITSKPLVAL